MDTTYPFSVFYFTKSVYEKAAKQSDSQATQLIHTSGLVPIYPETASVSSKWLRSRINAVLRNPSINLDNLEVLPEPILNQFHLIDLEAF